MVIPLLLSPTFVGRSTTAPAVASAKETHVDQVQACDPTNWTVTTSSQWKGNQRLFPNVRKGNNCPYQQWKGNIHPQLFPFSKWKFQRRLCQSSREGSTNNPKNPSSLWETWQPLWSPGEQLSDHCYLRRSISHMRNSQSSASYSNNLRLDSSNGIHQMLSIQWKTYICICVCKHSYIHMLFYI